MNTVTKSNKMIEFIFKLILEFKKITVQVNVAVKSYV